MKSSIRILLLMLLVLFVSDAVYAQPEIVFSGRPSIKVQEYASNATTVQLSDDESKRSQVLVVRDGENYLWASRDNKPLAKSVSGEYTTYYSLDGSGYIRIQSPEATAKFKGIVSESNQIFDYREHLLQGLASITYYGKTR